MLSLTKLPSVYFSYATGGGTMYLLLGTFGYSIIFPMRTNCAFKLYDISYLIDH